MNQLKFAVAVFDQRRATFYPVTIIAVELVVDQAKFRLVNVPADNTVDLALLALSDGSVLKCGDCSPSVGDTVFYVVGQ